MGRICKTGKFGLKWESAGVIERWTREW